MAAGKLVRSVAGFLRAAFWSIDWPVAGFLLVALALDGTVTNDLPLSEQMWGLPAPLTMCALALLASRLPVVAGAAAPIVLVVWSTALRLAGPAPLSMAGVAALSAAGAAETVAILAVVVAVIRRTSTAVAVRLMGLILACGVTAWAVRPGSPDSVSEPAWYAVAAVLAVLAGWFLRTRDNETARGREAAVTAARQEERVALARELHDVVAHHIGGMVVQAQAAQVVAGPDPSAPARVLPVIEQSGAKALSAVRLMADMLGNAGEGRPADLVAELNAVTVTPAGGVPVGLTVELPEHLPADVATTVLRVVQESVTNARRYASAAGKITVEVLAGEGIVRVRVRDDGRHEDRPRNSGGGSFGLVGMRERVHLLGGRFSAGRMPEKGWQVLADLPFPR